MNFRNLRLFRIDLALALAMAFPLNMLTQTATGTKKIPQVASQRQEPKAAPFTNAEIISMVEAGIQPQIIKTAIRQATSRQFDLTAKGLIDLKQHKVPDDVLAIMQDPNASDVPTPALMPAQQSSSDPVPPNPAEPAGLPKEQGIFYKGQNGWVTLQDIQSSGSKTTGMGKALLTGGWAGSGDVVMVFSGAEAPVQISESKPVFYCRPQVQSPRDLMIVRVAKKKDHRELQTTTGAIFKSAGYKKDNVVEVSATTISADIMALTPTADLKDGEYLLVFSYGGAGGYDFGINQKKK